MAEKKKNKAQLRLEAHQAKMIQFQEDIKNLGNPNDYTNKANYTGKVNELRKKYGVAGIGQDLNTYMNKLKREEGKLKKVVTSRYIKRAPVGLLERLVIDDYDNIGTRYSDKNSLGYKINPDYVESLDPAGETQLKAKAEQKEALRIQKLEEQDRLRGSMTDSEMEMSEQGTWGPSPTWGIGDGVNINITGNQPNNASQLAINNSNVSPDYEREVARDLNPNEVRTWSTDGGKETVYKDFKEFDEKDASGAKAKWLADTANSPAAQAGLSDEMRWAARQNHLKWLKDKKNKKKLAITSPMDMD
tara:strand:- start:2012 stop:2920 length:909 start_codon:yes stop_codon:yes gene_type:complete